MTDDGYHRWAMGMAGHRPSNTTHHDSDDDDDGDSDVSPTHTCRRCRREVAVGSVWNTLYRWCDECESVTNHMKL